MRSKTLREWLTRNDASTNVKVEAASDLNAKKRDDANHDRQGVKEQQMEPGYAPEDGND